MSDHYYSKQPQSQLKTEKIQSRLRNRDFIFMTSSGVFSKRAVDYGSRLLIESFRAPHVDGPILDLGCGYGPIGISLASAFPERSIWMTDLNERAVALAQTNIRHNHIDNAEAFVSEGFDRIECRDFAAILTNPPIRTGKKVVYPLMEQSVQHLRAEGELWAVIQKKQGAPSFQKFLESLFSKVTVENKRKGYYIIRAIK